MNPDFYDYDDLLRNFKEKAQHSIGYPTNHKFDYKELYPFMDYMLNNVGDPFHGGSNYTMNTHDIERKVIEWFADLYNAPKNNLWGYVTNGGTEGNMYGMYLAREAFPHSILYFSESTHYSVRKLAHILDMTYVIIKSDGIGRMDMDDFKEQVSIRRDKAAIVFANFGTTMTGAIDDIVQIKAILKSKAIHHYIHVDAALLGLFSPFVTDGIIDFDDGIDSISVSGHKMIGMPFPSGAVVAKKNFVDRVKSPVEYIGSHDTTISGSRNALSVLMFWYAINTYDFYNVVDDICEVMTYAQNRLNERLKPNFSRNILSNIITFPKPSDEIIKKWQLATEGNIAHIVIMPHVTKDMIDAFCEDLKLEKTSTYGKF